MDEEDYDMYGKNGCELDQQLRNANQIKWKILHRRWWMKI